MANTDSASTTPLPRYNGRAVKPVRNGLGIVTLRAISAGVQVCQIKGRILTARAVWRFWDSDPQRAENCYRYDSEHYLDPHGDISQYANHSCNPNCGIFKDGDQLALVSRIPIARGAEITHDYSTLLGADDVWSMACNCGEKNCRKRVRNIRHLPASTFSEYVSKGLIPSYILATLPLRR